MTIRNTQNIIVPDHYIKNKLFIFVKASKNFDDIFYIYSMPIPWKIKIDQDPAPILNFVNFTSLRCNDNSTEWKTTYLGSIDNTKKENACVIKAVGEDYDYHRILVRAYKLLIKPIYDD